VNFGSPGSHLATIRDGFVDEDVLSEVDGTPAIFVRVEAGEEHSVFGISNAIGDWLRTYQPPAGVEVEVWNNTVDEVLDRFSGILLNAVIGMILVFVCLVLVFDLRVATWIAVGIPISFIGALSRITDYSRIAAGPADSRAVERKMPE